MVDCATLASIEFHSLNNLIDPIHRNYLLDILLFQESMQCYLELLVILYISLKSLALPHTEAIKAATESLKHAHE